MRQDIYTHPFSGETDPEWIEYATALAEVKAQEQAQERQLLQQRRQEYAARFGEEPVAAIMPLPTVRTAPVATPPCTSLFDVVMTWATPETTKFLRGAATVLPAPAELYRATDNDRLTLGAEAVDYGPALPLLDTQSQRQQRRSFMFRQLSQTYSGLLPRLNLPFGAIHQDLAALIDTLQLVFCTRVALW